jgi:hypothetical protein
MRKLLFLPLAFVCLYSCKPDGSNETPKVNTNDPKAVSSTLKIWHGARISGELPASNNNTSGPVLNPQSNNQNIKALAGKYAIIQPEVMSDKLSGYYIKVNGAADYFKVDYKKPREGGRSKSRLNRHNRSLAKGFGIDSTGGGGNLDSTIVIVIPTSIQPGQFCMTYCAYDSLGNVSNPITVCITVLAFGGDASSSYLNGTWHITGTSVDTTQGWDPVYGVGDTIFSQGYCINNHIVDSFGTGPVTYPQFIYSITKADLLFSSNGGLKYEFAETSKEFNYNSSSCSNYVFNTDSYNDQITGAWSHVTSSGKLILIFDFDPMGNMDPEAYEYKLIKLSNNKIYLHDQDYDEYLRLEK